MKLVLVVVGDGRGEYLEQAVPAVLHNTYHPIAARCMVDDSGDPDYARTLDEKYPEFVIDHGGRRGMAGAVQTGMKMALTYDPDYVLWVEEDMLITRPLPILAASEALDRDQMLAQMCFRREPWWGSPIEIEQQDQLLAIMHEAAYTETRDKYVVHDYLFSLNPCLIPRRVLQLGWPSGPLGVGNEAGMTTKLINLGYRFASWGPPERIEPYVRHIGVERGHGWQL